MSRFVAGQWLLCAAAVFFLLRVRDGVAAPSADILFNRDIRPILSDNCLPCHGFDSSKRKGGLRLDISEGATVSREGHQAIKPGDLNASELWRRVNSQDPKVTMPPPDSGKKLKSEQVTLLAKWIEQGATYQKHWAFEPPVRPELPTPRDRDWSLNPIDDFILAKLEAANLKPSPEARKETLVRRVTLDLTGLPPSLDEVTAFLADDQPGAYERLVDRLLQSPRYGENMARYWLDVARYGDTHGLHLDNERSMWPYRDWVVEAFNENLPYDRFTIWQLAGDLLPDPTRAQLIASGFNRCNVSTSEGGAIDEEFQARYAVDRVETTSAAWLGLTMGCAVCHDHKLEPITQKEFYQMFSIFNNISEKAMDGNALLPPPTLSLPSPEQEQKLKDFGARITKIQDQIREEAACLNYIDPATLTNAPKPEPKELIWVDDAFPAKAESGVNGINDGHRWIRAGEGPVFAGERAFLSTGKGVHQAFFTESKEPLIVSPGAKLFAYVYLDPMNPPKAVMLQFFTGDWRNRANWGDADAIPFGAKDTYEKVQAGPLPETGRWARLEIEAAKLGLKPGTRITGLAFTQFDGKAYWDKAGIYTSSDPAEDPAYSMLAWFKTEAAAGDKSESPKEIKELLKKDFGSLAEDERTQLRDHYLAAVYAAPHSPLATYRAEIEAMRKEREALEKEIPATLISKELEKPRPAWVLIRGEYDKHGEPVGPGVPSVLPPLPESDTTNRLTFARWLTSTNHPLTARVTVNRMWQQFFGVGLVKTTEDFGNRGEWPSHPELLDWLATEFIRTGWDVKALVKLLVTSAAYRQDSRVTPALYDRDPENRLLARGPRLRLDAEALRDEALFLGGLLNFQTGGRGVRTYQPPGIWEAVGYTTSNTAKYSQDAGNALYRRSLYLFWKRTAPPPSMTTFDSPSREKCTTRRERTNTPLQALLTMNDVQYFEAARHLGYRMLREGGNTDADRLRYGFRLATARVPDATECSVLNDTLTVAKRRYVENSDAARKVIAVGESPVPADVPAPDLAAYTIVGNLLLNLDEVLTKN